MFILQRLFGKKIDIGVELMAGLTTFLTMAYIIIVNPQVLSAAGMDKASLIAVTCLVSAVATIVTGLFANAPIAMAPGMGLNAFFAYSLVAAGKVSWPTALGIVFLSGLFFLVLTLIGLRRKLVQAIPRSLLQAISVGIGLFITFIGLVNLGLIVKSDATLVSAASVLSPTILIGLAGLLCMVLCEIKKIKGSLLLGILFSTLLAVLFGFVHLPARYVSLEPSIRPLFGALDVPGALKWGLLSSVFTLMFMDLFDSIGTLVACAQEAKMVDTKGEIRMLDRLLSLDALATMFGAVCGTSTTTSYIESAAGIEAGGRTGLSAVTTGALFLLAMLFVPVIGIIPGYATAPALIMVGFFMMKNIVHIDLKDIENSFPAFIIIVMIALSYSISTGLAFGFIAYTALKALRGKWGQVRPVLWLITALSVLYFLI